MDLLRGIAMMMVVLGHTMTGSTAGSEETLLFNVIWSLQMPLFFMISGYVTRYGRPAGDLRGLGRLLWKRTAAYMIPWAVWSFLIRGLLVGQTEFFDLKYLLWHMDAGYWYLPSLWTISLIFAAAQWAAGKMGDRTWKYWITLGGCYLLGMVVLLGLGLVMGLGFFCIKLTLYYMPFFALGVLLGQTGEKLYAVKTLRRCSMILASLMYALILWKINLFKIPDDIMGILLRITSALSGAMCLYGLIRNVSGVTENIMIWVGRNSLGIYLSHTLVLAVFKLEMIPPAESLLGMGIVVGKFIGTMVLSSLISWLLDRNSVISRLCLGK